MLPASRNWNYVQVEASTQKETLFDDAPSDVTPDRIRHVTMMLPASRKETLLDDSPSSVTPDRIRHESISEMCARLVGLSNKYI